MYDTKISTDKSLDKGQKIDLDFDIIGDHNAIMSKPFGGSFVFSDGETYGGKIHSGITMEGGRYFFFEYSIINKPRRSGKDPNSWHSYYIYQITGELFEEISRSQTFNIWNVKFNSLYHFGKCILSVRRGNYVENKIFYSKLEGDTLTIPYGISPSNLSKSDSETIGEFLEWHAKTYIYSQNSQNILLLNRPVFRENLLESILST